MELNNQTEIDILDAAEKVFYKKGKNGTSMQDIADEAGITRTSLNYYYRSKDKLFEAVFREALTHFVPKLAKLMNSADNFTDYISKFVKIFIDTMLEKPHIPIFMLQEITSNTERVPQLMMELGIHPAEAISKVLEDPVLKDLQIDPRQIMMNVLSMCIFPFAGKPLLVPILFHGDGEAFVEAMEQRKFLIPLMIENMIKSYK